MAAVKSLVDLLFPPTCLFCRLPLLTEEREGHLCAACLKKAPFFSTPGCSFCAGRPEYNHCCTRGRPRSFSFSGTVALGWYGGDLKECLHRLKYGSGSHLAKPLGQLLARCISQQKDWPPISAITPIPLHPRRLRERGYNQSGLLAQEVASRLGIPVADLFERQRNTPPQTRLSREERLHNLKGAFRLKQQPPPRPFPFSALSRPASFLSLPVRGKVFLLVDDIFTTGSTLEEAASLLLYQGASRVYNAVVAR